MTCWMHIIILFYVHMLVKFMNQELIKIHEYGMSLILMYLSLI